MTKFKESMVKFRDGAFGPTIILFVICAVITLALTFVYQGTADIIAAAGDKAADEARKEVLPDADSFTLVEAEYPEGVLEVYQAGNGAGYVIKSQAKGFDGMVTYMVGMNGDGSIVGINMFEHTETPGLGTKVGEPSYLENYYNQPDPYAVDSVTGATLTSNSLKNALVQALYAYAEVTGAELDVPEMAEDGPTPEIVIDDSYTAVSAALPEGVTEAYEANDGSGYIFKAQAKGYDGTVQFIVQTDADGKFVAIHMGDNNETPGIGSRVGEIPYLTQYYGHSNVDGVDALSGATVTTKALKKALDASLEAFESISGKTVDASGGPADGGAPAEEVEEETLDEIDLDSYEEVEGVELPENVLAAYRSDAGYVLESQGKGYDGQVVYLIQLSGDGVVENINVVKHTETPNLGTRVFEPDYISQYFGVSSADEVDGVDAIAGATMTTRSLKRALGYAFDAYELVKEAA